MTGGSKPKSAGTYAERMVKAYMEEHGWYVTRAWGSLGPWDLLGLSPGRRPAMVQVKSPGQRYSVELGAYLMPEERRNLLRMAVKAGAAAVLCYYPRDNRSVQASTEWYELVDLSEYVPWSPLDVVSTEPSWRPYP